MKIRIRNYELTLATLLVGITLAHYLWESLSLSKQDIDQKFGLVFANHNLSFHYFSNVLSPKLGVIIFSFLLYLSLNLLNIPKLLVSRNQTFKQYCWATAFILLVSFLLALSVNVATFFTHPYLFSYAGYRFLSLFGYNDLPMQDAFFGLQRALVMVGVYLVYACAKELLIMRIQKSARKDYWALVTNQIGLAIVIYLVVLFFTATFVEGDNELFYTIYISFISPGLVVSLTNIFWIFPSSGNKHWLNIRTITLIACTTLFYTFLTILIPRQFFLPSLWLTSWAAQLFIVTPLTWLIYTQQKDKLLQLRGTEKALMKSKADLQFLRSQINPHFLFNALNTLYGTALIDGSERTAEGIQKLGDMMRFMLHDNHLDFIPMNNEISYLKNYISLQKLRIQPSSRIKIEENIDNQNCTHTIVPMLLIPFVENAFKHGIHSNEESWIRIGLNCNTTTIRFEVRNSIHPVEANDPENEHSGIGLENVRERLHLFYENRHKLQCGSDGKEFVAILTIETNH